MPAIDVFEAVAGALLMDVKLTIDNLELEPDDYNRFAPFFFAPGAQPPKLAVSADDVRRVRDAMK